MAFGFHVLVSAYLKSPDHFLFSCNHFLYLVVQFFVFSAFYPYQLYVAYIYSHNRQLISPLCQCLWMKYIPNFNVVEFINLSLYGQLFFVIFKRSFPTLQLQRYSILLSKSYVVLIFTFRSSIRLELIFMYDMRKEFPFSPSMDCQFCDTLFSFKMFKRWYRGINSDRRRLLWW